jgi:glutamyl-tRNA synthetase
MNKVRVRFAPSPTGPLHVGGVRTALFNYLFAKKHNGDFILRIEDTDQTRFVEGAEQYIKNSLKWTGIQIDEGVDEGGNYGPYKQSERKEIYEKYAQQLIDSGWGYYAFDTPEELDALRKKAEAEKTNFIYNHQTRNNLHNSLNMSGSKLAGELNSGKPYVIRFKMPENTEIIMHDIIRGEVKVNSSVLDDKILFKSDGLPTYHLANVVDDHLMKISHVIRGEEWLPSLALHVMLYKALGWESEMPQFAHLPLILKPTGKGKLSKRDGDKMGFPVFPMNWTDPKTGDIFAGYKEAGYFPEAFVNILAFLGWNPGDEREIMNMQELSETFELSKVSKSGARFDPDKARWYNHKYLQMKSLDELAEMFVPIIKAKGIKKIDTEYIKKVIELVRERANFISDLWQHSYFFFQTPTAYDAKTVKKRWKQDTPEIMQKIKNIIANIENNNFNRNNIHDTIVEFIEQQELGMGKVMNAIRLCIVGAAAGPDLFTIIEMIGKQETINRIEKALTQLKN